MGELSKYDEYTAFALEAVLGAMGVIRALKGGGTEVVATRDGSYKSWDPETFRVDKDTEDHFIDCVRTSRLNAVLLSEEAKRLDLSTSYTRSKPRVYVISDPFDGSWLYKRGIPAFWYTTWRSTTRRASRWRQSSATVARRRWTSATVTKRTRARCATVSWWTPRPSAPAPRRSWPAPASKPT